MPLSTNIASYDCSGISMFDDICTIDIDHCIEKCVLSDMAEDIIKETDNDTKLSPSGDQLAPPVQCFAPGLYDKDHYDINNLNQTPTQKHFNFYVDVCFPL